MRLAEFKHGMKWGLLLRFLMVGVLNTGFSYSIYAFGVYLGAPLAVANLIACLVGIFFSFRTQGALVFRGADDASFYRFFGIWLFLYGFNTLLIYAFVNLGLDAYTAGLLALPCVVALNFVLQKTFVFKSGKRIKE